MRGRSSDLANLVGIDSLVAATNNYHVCCVIIRGNVGSKAVRQPINEHTAGITSKKFAPAIRPPIDYRCDDGGKIVILR